MSRKKQAVGIDIGSKYMKIVMLDYNDESIEIKDYDIQKIPSKIIEDGVIKLPEDLAEIVSSLLKEKNIRVKNASIGISLGEDTGVIKRITTPDLTDKELNDAISLNVEEELMNPADTLYYNWERVSETHKNEDNSIDVILVGVMKKTMDSYLNFLRHAKIKPYFAEIDIFSTFRSVLHPDTARDSNTNKLIVDIGSNETIMGFIQNGMFRYVRNIPFGTETWIKGISDNNEVNTDDIEKKFINKELHLMSATEDNLENENYSDALENEVSNLIDYIQETIYFYIEEEYGVVDEIILSGGGSKTEGLETVIQDSLSIPTKIGTPYFYKNKEGNSPMEVPLLNTAIGLALKEVHDNVRY